MMIKRDFHLKVGCLFALYFNGNYFVCALTFSACLVSNLSSHTCGVVFKH